MREGFRLALGVHADWSMSWHQTEVAQNSVATRTEQPPKPWVIIAAEDAAVKLITEFAMVTCGVTAAA